MTDWLSTTRLAQVSGGYDPQGLTHFGNSPEIGIAGTDLGASIHHGGVTYVYFGDVILDPGRDGDAVGVIEDITIEETACLGISCKDH